MKMQFLLPTFLYSILFSALLSAIVHTDQKKEPEKIITPTYHAKTIADSLPGLSTRQLNEHKTLYKKYVDKRNQITQDLLTIDRSQPSKTYSPFRELKVEETYAMNGQLLHELYFENMTHKTTEIGPLMHDLIISSFGSVEQFKHDFLACAQVARGWVVTAYCIDDGTIRNFVLEEHNTHVPVLTIPLIVLDVYEHAYMIDYGTNIKSYINIFWHAINWNVVEKRVTQWVMKLRN